MESLDWSDCSTDGGTDEATNSTESDNILPVSSYEEDVEHIVGCITHREENTSDNSDIDQDDKASFFYGIADPVCIKLKDLICNVYDRK